MVRTEAFWRTYSSQYDAIWDSPLIDALRAEIHGELAGAARILDLGCGTGLLARAGRSAAEAGPGRVAGLSRDPSDRFWIGADDSVSMLERARALGRIDEALHADASHVPIHAGSVDAVVMANLLQFHPNPAAVVNEALRVVRPGGVVVATWPVDGLTPAMVWRAERRSGRRLASRLQARARRMWISALASRIADLGVEQHRDAETTRALMTVAESAGASVTDLAVWRSVQRLVIVRASRGREATGNSATTPPEPALVDASSNSDEAE